MPSQLVAKASGSAALFAPAPGARAPPPLAPKSSALGPQVPQEPEARPGRKKRALEAPEVLAARGRLELNRKGLGASHGDHPWMLRPWTLPSWALLLLVAPALPLPLLWAGKAPSQAPLRALLWELERVLLWAQRQEAQLLLVSRLVSALLWALLLAWPSTLSLVQPSVLEQCLRLAPLPPPSLILLGALTYPAAVTQAQS